MQFCLSNGTEQRYLCLVRRYQFFHVIPMPNQASNLLLSPERLYCLTRINLRSGEDCGLYMVNTQKTYDGGNNLS